jgi:DNA-directed RNA polymerase specialized sigma24 family protein
MSDELFYQRPVLRAIRGVLASKGILGEQDLLDGIHDVVLECLEQYGEKTGRSPRTLADAVAIARRLAQSYAVDKLRERSTRGKVTVESTDRPDDHAVEPKRGVDPVDRGKILENLGKGLEEDEREDLEDIADGESHSAIAARRGISVEASRKRLQVVRAKSKGILDASGWKKAAGVVAFLGGAGAVVYLVLGRDSRDVTKRQQDYAVEQRHFAADQCKARKWDECKNALDRAKEVDPEGESADEVKGMREAIEKGRGGAGGK